MEQPFAIPNLDPNSHTYHRLEHATPEHLYLTTRRCFIGPIPEGWLKSHRKSWYRQHLHLNYSSNAATFSAPANVSHQRRTTGLDNKPKEVQKQSFPQPDTIGDESEQTGEEEDNRRATPHVSTSKRQVSQTERPRSRNGDDAGKSQTTHIEESLNGQKHNPKSSPQHSKSKRSSSSSKRTPKRISNSPKDSTVSTVEEEGDESIPNTEVIESPDLKRISLVESQIGGLSPIDSRGNDLTGATASTASLIHRDAKALDEEEDGQGSQSVPQSVPRSILTKVKETVSRPSTQINDPTDTFDSSSPVRRHSRIHFNVPEDSTRANLLLKARLTQMDLRAPLRTVIKRRSTMDGQIIKMERMLVRADFTVEKTLPADYDEKTSQGIITSTLEKWREFMVVCRKTSKTEDADFVLQIYKSRVCTTIQSLLILVTDVETRSFQQLRTPNPRSTQLARFHSQGSVVLG
jgi:hypothetical protein